MSASFPFALRSINRHRRLAWMVSLLAVALSLLGMAISWFNPAIASPLKLGLDFTGGSQIQLSRVCGERCPELGTAAVQQRLDQLKLPANEEQRPPSLGGSAIQLLDGGSSLMLRLPNLSVEQGQAVVDGLQDLAGPFEAGGVAVDSIGPTLGDQLLRSSLISLLVSFIGIATYITFRYDRIYAVLAIFCLLHDVLITSGVFAWLGLLLGVEVNSLFAVALPTVAGYSVIDTVVVFDRIREKSKSLQG
ncbi:MAG: protein translocase subunit SecF, partial [Prochlorococcaceae cyanobacterium]